jgi:hypothetical protein
MAYGFRNKERFKTAILFPLIKRHDAGQRRLICRIAAFVLG